MCPDLDQLLPAVAAEDRGIDLTRAVLRCGWENLVVETQDGWILRFPRPHVAFDRELAVLRRLTGRLPAATPQVEWTGRHNRFAAYRRLDGHSFDPAAYQRAPEPQRESLARSLAVFLAAMHTALTPAEVDQLAIPAPDEPATAIPGITAELHQVPPARRSAIQELLDEATTVWIDGDVPGPTVVLHNDFHTGNMVLDQPVGALAGVWDFSCVQLGKPSIDLRYLANDSTDLLQRTADLYEQKSGHRIHIRAATLANRLEIVSDAVHTNQPATLEEAVSRWTDDDTRH